MDALIQFVDEMDGAHRRAIGRAGQVCTGLILAGRPIMLECAGTALIGRLLPALAHAAHAFTAEPDLTVRLWDSHSTEIAPPPPIWPQTAVQPRGDIAQLPCDRILVNYQPGSGTLLVFDRVAKRAWMWVRRADDIPGWEAAAPLRTLWHWWSQAWGGQLAHGAVVGRAGRGLLLTGVGGSGKSTSALACVDAGFDFLGDDYVLLHLGRQIAAHRLYSSAKLRPDHMQRVLPHWSNATRIAGADDEKTVVHVARAGRTSTLPVAAIVLPRITPNAVDTRLRSASSAEAWRALAPTSVCQLPGGEDQTVGTLGQIVRRLPIYVMELGPDVQQIPGVLAALLETGVAHAA